MSTSKSRKTRILIIGDAVAPTGFARVIRSIFQPIHDDYDIHQLATRFSGGPHDYPWPLHRADEGDSVYGYDRVGDMVAKIKPDIVFVLYDFAFLIKYNELLQQCRADAKVILYCPIESGPIAPEYMRQLHGVARFVLFTQYARQVIEASLNGVRQLASDFSFPTLEVIPHGLDRGRFFPLAESADQQREIARRALGLDDPEHRDAFIVLNANRNMPRKRIDLTIEGFAAFAKNKPANVKLYLHMATEDTGWNVVILAKRHNVFDRLIMTQADNTTPTFSDEKLNLLYNACDVGITTTTGEGWGMVSFEHAATKAAQIVPHHTSLQELWEGAAQFVQATRRLTYPGNLTDAHLVDPHDVAAALERLYDDPEHRETLATAGYENATGDKRRWETIVQQWRRVFEETTAVG